ncbi:hypothetical protein LAZ40_06855 [Cereibacter sphaeroides]|uniref:hypothetical protein n=1 Tax=Cereibacter sphaeroides TaxID=1063 RepID=UPI001F1B65FF|nr:hypothetical protein [Cereibacter sphaeroides]MCE6958766.1 hypothetical protein [Cereibacter sphaeroides]MCE6973360.1 hypothetical protein [Cereibacter sphaeroides]
MSSFSSLLFRLCLLLLLVAAAPAARAGTPYEEAGVKPGQVITNVAVLTAGPAHQEMARASVSFTVANLPVHGTLRAFEYAYDGIPGVKPETFRFAHVDRSSGNESGPFVRSGTPTDRSSLTGSYGTLDLSGPIQVREVDKIRHGTPVFFVIEDSSFNIASDRVDTVVITLTDAVTGDEEYLRLYETAPDSGIFTGWIETLRTTARHADGIMSTTGYSRVDAFYIDRLDARNTLKTEVAVGPVDPLGKVFDSRTGTPVDGVSVTLIDVATGKPARVYGDDVSSAYPSTVVTGGKLRDASGREYRMDPGQFRFPFVYPGNYRYDVALPQGYDAPTQVADADLAKLEGGPFHVTTGSRLEAFEIEPGPPVLIDIPVDRNSGGSVTRDANVSVAEPGDLFQYVVHIESPDTRALDIVDTLPATIRFVPGTFRLNGRPLDPVVSPDGRILTVGRFATYPGQEIDITYTAQVSLGAKLDDLQDSRTTISEAGTGRLRLSADHRLRLVAAFDMDNLALLGQVVAGRCGAPETGRDLSGIRVMLESGVFAVTDKEGRFSFRDIPARPHVVQLDETTLPPHGHPVLCQRNTRNAGSAISQFVDVAPGLMGRAEFYVEFDRAAEETERTATLDEREWEPSNPADTYDQAWLDAQPAVTAPRVLTPAKGELPYSDSVDVFVLHAAGQKVTVFLDGEEVPTSRLDTGLTNGAATALVTRYRGIRITEGRNPIRVLVTSADGTELLNETQEVLYATDPAEAEVVTAGSVLESDGRTTPVLRMRLTDRNGIPIRPGTQVQVSTEKPFAFMPPPARRSEPGFASRPSQSATVTVHDDGMIRLVMAPVLETWTARIRIAAGEETIEQRVRISAADRPWVLVGLAEGTLAERTVRDHMRRSGDIGNDLSGRVSLFAEGVVKGEWLLTMRLDTARDGKGEFEGIDPDKDYIVYGDRSWQDDASPSRFPLYVRLRKEGAEYLLGDFDMNVQTNLISLGQKMTGVRALLETETWRVMAFAAKTSQRFVEDRIAIDGTMGPYRLTRSDIVLHSETVRLVEVSRIDVGEELSSTDLVAGRDYILSATTGELFLRKPIPAFTEDLNRQVLVISYETDEDIADGLMAGIRAEVQVSERVRAGGTVIHARNMEGKSVDVTLVGGDVTFEVNEALTLSAEALQVRKTSVTRSATGTQAELRAEYDDGISTGKVYLRRQRGNVGLDSSLEDTRTDTLGAEFSARMRAPVLAADEKEDPEDKLGLWLEGAYIGERDHVLDRTTQDGEIFVVNRTRDYEYGMGFRAYGLDETEKDARTLHAASKLSWTTKDERITWGIGAGYALLHEGTPAADELQFSIKIRATDRLDLLATWEGEHDRVDGDLAGVGAVGFEYALGETGSIAMGFASAAHGTATGQSFHASVDKSLDLTKETSLSFGMDMQRDLGAKDIPLGLSSDNPFIEGSFVTARGEVRHTRETWSVGLEAERRWADIGDRMNIRFSADGEIDEKWTVGGEALYGVSTETGEEGHEIDIHLSAAHRGLDRDPITLLQLEAKGNEEDGVDNLKVYGSVYHSRYLDQVSHLNARYGVKFQSLGTEGGTTHDVMQFAGLEYRHDLTEQVDIGLQGSVMQSAASGETKSSLGASLGFTPFENGWVSLGYNVQGFRDPEFSEDGYTDKGAFVQFRMKFDQNTVRNMFR